MLDFDLAELYEVETRAVNQAVKRNTNRFPEEFMFQLNLKEWRFLMSQIVISKPETRGGTQKLPYAFTEYGVVMLASVLRSDKAVEMNIAIVRAFIALKEIALKQGKLSEQISAFKRLLEQRIDEHDAQLKHIYDTLEELLDKKVDEELEKEAWKNRDRIGFKS